MTLTADVTTYATIAEAEAAIQLAGYTRDTQRHLWVLGNDAVKVVRTADNKLTGRRFVCKHCPK